MSNNLEIQEEIYYSPSGAFRVNKALFKNEPCFSVQNNHGGVMLTVLFDYDMRIMRAVVSKMKRVGMSADIKESGSGFMFKFQKKEKEQSISLRTFLWGKYHNIPPKKTIGLNIQLLDKETFSSNIMDMRSRNLYDAGGTATDGISIIHHIVTNEPFIMVQYEDRTEFLEYSPEMYQMLTTRKICSQCKRNKQKKDNGRLFLNIRCKCGKDGQIIRNLSRFALIFDEHYKRFENYRNGNITRFLHSIPEIDPGKEIECGHLNARSWIDCNENMLFMKNELNGAMSTYAGLIDGKYSMLPIAWKADSESKILIEWNAGEALVYFVCESVEDYVDFQKVILGKKPMIRDLSLVAADSDGNRTQFKTPMQSARSPVEKQEKMSVHELTTELWRWCDGRDRVLGLYKNSPGVFWTWQNTDKNMAADVLLRQILRLFGVVL